MIVQCFDKLSKLTIEADFGQPSQSLCDDNHCQNIHTEKSAFSSDTNSNVYLNLSVCCVIYFGC